MWCKVGLAAVTLSPNGEAAARLVKCRREHRHGGG